jgi:hypothetical protein
MVAHSGAQDAGRCEHMQYGIGIIVTIVVIVVLLSILGLL